MQLRSELPFLLDVFGVETEPKSRKVPLANGKMHDVSFLPFSGDVNPSAPLQGDPQKFANSVATIANSFAHSNWNEALLPTGLQQLLVQKNVSVMSSGEKKLVPSSTPHDAPVSLSKTGGVAATLPTSLPGLRN